MSLSVASISTSFRIWLRSIFELPLIGLLLILVAGLFIIGQQPFHYAFPVGREDGIPSDLPFVEGWNTAEGANGLTYRWSAEDSHIRLSGLPRKPMLVTLGVLSATLNPEHEAGVLVVSSGATPLVTYHLPSTSRSTHILVPTSATPHGRLDLLVRTPVWTPKNDPRVLGMPASNFEVEAIGGPSLRPTLQLFWPIFALLLLWLPLRRWLRSRWGASAVAGIVVTLLLVVCALDRPRFALGGPPVLWAIGWGLVLAIVLRLLAEYAAPRLKIELSAAVLNLIALLFFGLFVLRYTGRLYPYSMPGDLGFHVNRQNEVIAGHLFLVSKHRGINFPYPPILYMAMAPLRLFPFTAEQVVNFGDALFGALGIFPIAFAVAFGFRRERVVIFATLVYALLAPAIMSLWWSFLTHIFAQEFSALLIAGLIVGWAALQTRRGMFVLFVGFALLFTSHLGFYINISLLVVVVLLAELVRRWRAGEQLIDLRRPRSGEGLLIAFVAAQVTVLLLFYSAYAGLVIEKLSEFAQGGMGEVQGGRQATPQAVLWRTLWRTGLGVHYATVGVPLALLGSYRIWTARTNRVLPLVFGAMLAVAVIQAAIPFLTASTITTRWLSFAAPFVAIGLALLLDTLWSWNWSGRLLSILILLWIGGTTLWMWLQAMAFRIRPPEPF